MILFAFKEALSYRILDRQQAEQRRAEQLVKKKAQAEQAKRDKDKAARDQKLRTQKIRSAVFLAARKGDEEKVKKGIYEDSVDAAGGEVKRGNEDLLDKSKFPQDPLETLLHIAASRGNKQLVEWLIDHSMLILVPPS